MSQTLSPFHPVAVIATWFGSGRVPKISGTAGSLAALPFAWFVQHLFGNYVLLATSFALFIIGCAVSDMYLARTGKTGDPREIVIDEVCGQCLLLSMFTPDLFSYVVGFILFRLFDIVKPWPISVANNKIKNGFGIMVDDVLAALYPALFLFVLKVAMIFSLGLAQAPYLKLFLPVENIE